jgi:succinate dehydrogenase / fumarate reductase membrane anchor subunit
MAWRDWLYAPYNSLFMGLFILAILFHAWIGMRDVILDYIHNVMLRLVILTGIIVVLLICGLWSLRILLIPMVI